VWSLGGGYWTSKSLSDITEFSYKCAMFKMKTLCVRKIMSYMRRSYNMYIISVYNVANVRKKFSNALLRNFTNYISEHFYPTQSQFTTLNSHIISLKFAINWISFTTNISYTLLPAPVSVVTKPHTHPYNHKNLIGLRSPLEQLFFNVHNKNTLKQL